MKVKTVSVKLHFPPIFIRKIRAWILHKHTVKNYWLWEIEHAIYGAPDGRTLQNVTCKRCGKEKAFEYFELLNQARKEFPNEYIPA